MSSGSTTPEEREIAGSEEDVLHPEDSPAANMELLTFRENVDNVFRDLTNRQIPTDYLEIISRSFEKKSDGDRVVLTLDGGIERRKVKDGAFDLEADVQFLPGGDLQQVTLLEQDEMKERETRQMSGHWRAHTAAKLLAHYDLSPNLVIKEEDQTALIVDQAKKTLQKAPWQMVLSGSSKDRLVSINSDNIRMVTDLRDSTAHFSCTIIELEGKSLISLMVKFRHLMIQEGTRGDWGPERIVSILEAMIEDSRRLFLQSPILSRMSTRYKIIHSRNTRYGVDDGFMFRTMTTSESIREMLETGAAFYDSLNGTPGEMQAKIRPMFLQMLVLLLSLLNETDRQLVQRYVESTYGLKADRRSLELAILKILPLKSNNSEIFLSALIRAYTGQNPINSNLAHTWASFLKDIAEQGYILAGASDRIGIEDGCSWMFAWNSELKDSNIFNNLQYNGEHRALNDIPSLDLFCEYAIADIPVTLFNGRHYSIRSNDYSKVLAASAGTYLIKDQSSHISSKLDIKEINMNPTMSRMVKETSRIIRVINPFILNYTEKTISRLLSKQKPRTLYADIQTSGILSMSIVTVLSQDQSGYQKPVAVVYKKDGQKIDKSDIERAMHSDLEKVRAFSSEAREDLKKFQDPKRWHNTGMRKSIEEVQERLERLKALITDASTELARLNEFPPDIHDEVFDRVHQPTAYNSSNQSVWSSYSSSYSNSDGSLRVESLRFMVDNLSLDGHIFRLSLKDSTMALEVQPLEDLPEEKRRDEINKGDWILLVGRLIIVVRDVQGKLGEVMGYMRIVKFDQPVFSKRNRKQRVSKAKSCLY